MTVAPELPPALDRRSAEGARPARAARRRAPAPHPTGAVAPRTPAAGRAPVPVWGPARRTGLPPAPGRTAGRAPSGSRASAHLRVAPTRSSAPVDVPVERVPGPRLPSRVDLDPSAPASPPAPRQRAIVELRPGVGTAGQHHPAVPGRLQVTGVRVVRVVRPARPPMRLTVRGRLLVALLVGIGVVMGMLLATSRMDALREPASPVPATAPAAVVVQPGESLWTIAERVAPDRDPRVVVDQLRRLNELPSADVQAGQRILLRAP